MEILAETLPVIFDFLNAVKIRRQVSGKKFRQCRFIKKHLRTAHFQLKFLDFSGAVQIFFQPRYAPRLMFVDLIGNQSIFDEYIPCFHRIYCAVMTAAAGMDEQAPASQTLPRRHKARLGVIHRLIVNRSTELRRHAHQPLRFGFGAAAGKNLTGFHQSKVHQPQRRSFALRQPGTGKNLEAFARHIKKVFLLPVIAAQLAGQTCQQCHMQSIVIKLQKFCAAGKIPGVFQGYFA